MQSKDRSQKGSIWELDGRPYTGPLQGIGFVYEISFSNGRRYIGKKVFFHTIKLKPLKGKRAKRVVQRPSKWEVYEGSIKDPGYLKDRASGKVSVTRKEIICFCQSKTHLSYMETRELFLRDALLSSQYYNNNILGKFYREKLIF